MIRQTLFAVSAAVVALASSAAASTLTFSVECREVTVKEKGGTRVLHVRTPDEPVIAHVTVDVYFLPKVPATKLHLEELRQMSRKTWWSEIAWDVRDGPGRRVEVKPQLVKSSVRDRGPDAKREADRDMSAPTTTFDATFDLGRLPAGTYTLQVTIRGLVSSNVPLDVRPR